MKRRVRFAEATDGLANTVFLSETVVVPNSGATPDERGRHYNAPNGGVVFTTAHGPNSAVGDQLPFGCIDAKPLAPCAGTANVTMTARSAHPRGVNAALADGSVRMVPNDVNSTIWQNLGSRAGGETTGSF